MEQVVVPLGGAEQVLGVTLFSSDLIGAEIDERFVTVHIHLKLFHEIASLPNNTHQIYHNAFFFTNNRAYDVKWHISREYMLFCDVTHFFIIGLQQKYFRSVENNCET